MFKGFVTTIRSNAALSIAIIVIVVLAFVLRYFVVESRLSKNRMDELYDMGTIDGIRKCRALDCPTVETFTNNDDEDYEESTRKPRPNKHRKDGEATGGDKCIAKVGKNCPQYTDLIAASKNAECKDPTPCKKTTEWYNTHRGIAKGGQNITCINGRVLNPPKTGCICDKKGGKIPDPSDPENRCVCNHDLGLSWDRDSQRCLKADGSIVDGSTGQVGGYGGKPPCDPSQGLIPVDGKCRWPSKKNCESTGANDFDATANNGKGRCVPKGSAGAGAAVAPATPATGTCTSQYNKPVPKTGCDYKTCGLWPYQGKCTYASQAVCSLSNKGWDPAGRKCTTATANPKCKDPKKQYMTPNGTCVSNKTCRDAGMKISFASNGAMLCIGAGGATTTQSGKPVTKASDCSSGKYFLKKSETNKSCVSKNECEAVQGVAAGNLCYCQKPAMWNGTKCATAAAGAAPAAPAGASASCGAQHGKPAKNGCPSSCGLWPWKGKCEWGYSRAICAANGRGFDGTRCTKTTTNNGCNDGDKLYLNDMNVCVNLAKCKKDGGTVTFAKDGSALCTTPTSQAVLDNDARQRGEHTVCTSRGNVQLTMSNGQNPDTMQNIGGGSWCVTPDECVTKWGGFLKRNGNDGMCHCNYYRCGRGYTMTLGGNRGSCVSNTDGSVKFPRCDGR